MIFPISEKIELKWAKNVDLIAFSDIAVKEIFLYIVLLTPHKSNILPLK